MTRATATRTAVPPCWIASSPREAPTASWLLMSDGDGQRPGLEHDREVGRLGGPEAGDPHVLPDRVLYRRLRLDVVVEDHGHHLAPVLAGELVEDVTASSVEPEDDFRTVRQRIRPYRGVLNTLAIEPRLGRKHGVSDRLVDPEGVLLNHPPQDHVVAEQRLERRVGHRRPVGIEIGPQVGLLELDELGEGLLIDDVEREPPLSDDDPPDTLGVRGARHLHQDPVAGRAAFATDHRLAHSELVDAVGEHFENALDRVVPLFDAEAVALGLLERREVGFEAHPHAALQVEAERDDPVADVLDVLDLGAKASRERIDDLALLVGVGYVLDRPDLRGALCSTR